MKNTIDIQFERVVNSYLAINPETPTYMLDLLVSAYDGNLNLKGNSISVEGDTFTQYEQYLKSDLSEEETKATIVDNVKELLSMEPEKWEAEKKQSYFDYFAQKILNQYSDTITHYEEVSEDLYKLIIDLAHLNDGGSIFNPFAGDARLGHLCNKDQYYGAENDIILHDIASMRFYLKYGQSRMLEKGHYWPNPDHVVCIPPSISKDCKDWEYYDNTDAYFKTQEGYALFLSLKSIGRGACIVPIKMLYGKDEDSEFLRVIGINRNKIEMVISLPVVKHSGITSTPCALIITQGERYNNRNVRLIDATSCIKKVDSKETIDYDSISYLANTAEEDNRIILADRYDISESEKLSPKYHIALCETKNINVPEGFHSIYLNEVLGIANNRYQGKDEMPICTPSSLQGDGMISHLFADRIKVSKPTSKLVMVDQYALLVSNVGGVMKTAIFNPYNGPILLNNNVRAYYIKNSEVMSLSYLCGELHEEYVLRQIPNYGSSMPTFKAEDLLGIRVIVPDSEDEFTKRVLLHEKDGQRKLEIAAENVKKDLLEEYKKDMHLRKHAIGQVLGSMNSAYSIFQSYFEDKEELLQEVVGLRTGKTLKDYLEGFGNSLERICNLINSLTDETVFGEETDIDIEDTWNEYKKSSSAQDFKILEAYNLSDKLAHHTVHIDKNCLIQIFDNIVTNAQRYGFTDETRKDYNVNFETKDEVLNGNTAVRIFISNNGSPLIKGMTPDKIFQWGVGQHTGLGTWQVKQMIEHYGGTVELRELTESEYTICYEIVLPTIEN